MTKSAGKTMKTTLRTAALLAAVVAQPVSALDQALSDPELAALRGGFTTATGMTISFGIERATWINGELRAHHELKAGELTLGRSTGILAGASVASGIEPVVIQNSLNQQVIQSCASRASDTAPERGEQRRPPLRCAAPANLSTVSARAASPAHRAPLP